MKKSSFVALVIGTVSGLMFALGMCMALLPEWNAFTEGVIFGAVGVVLAVVTVFVWRKMTKKAPIKLSGRGILATAVGIVGALSLGIGMCFCMVWNNLPVGIAIGVIGIVILLCLIPIVKGLEE